jgi:hypothetical protein
MKKICAAFVFALTYVCVCTAQQIPYTPADGVLPATYTSPQGEQKSVLLPVTWGSGQATIPAQARFHDAQIGLQGTYLAPDYGRSVTASAGAYGAYTGRHFGIEADAMDTVGSDRSGIREASAVVGPTFVVRKGAFVFGVKAQVGAGHFAGDPLHTSVNHDTYVLESYGGSVDIRLVHHVNLRLIDGDYQVWQGFNSHNLTPFSLGAGIAYRF